MGEWPLPSQARPAHIHSRRDPLLYPGGLVFSVFQSIWGTATIVLNQLKILG